MQSVGISNISVTLPLYDAAPNNIRNNKPTTNQQERPIMKKLASIIALQLAIAGSVYANTDIDSLSKQVASLQAQVNALHNSSNNSKDYIVSNKAAFSNIFSGGAAYIDKTSSLLKMISNNQIPTGQTSLGGKLESVTSYSSNNYNSESNSNLSTQAKFGIISRPSDLFTAVVTLNAKDSGGVQPYSIYGVLGNLNRSPLYLIAGYKNIDFGYMARYSNVISNFNRLFNSSNSTQVEAGYYKNGLNAMVTVFNGSSQTHTNGNQISNIAANIAYTMNISNSLTTSSGGGVLNSINSTAKLMNSDSITLTTKKAPAWDLFQTFTYAMPNQSKVNAYIEYVQASRNGLNSTKPASLSSSIEYQFNAKGWTLIPSFNYSHLSGAAFTADPTNTASLNQYVLSMATYVGPVKVGVDYGHLITPVYKDDVAELHAEYLFG